MDNKKFSWERAIPVKFTIFRVEMLCIMTKSLFEGQAGRVDGHLSGSKRFQIKNRRTKQ